MNINLLPAAQPKAGEGLDLPLVLAAAACRGHLRSSRLSRTLFLGEVGIDGSLHPVRGGLAAAVAAREAGLSELVAPTATAQEAACLPELKVYAAESLAQVMHHLTGNPSPFAALKPPPDLEHGKKHPSLDDVRGQTLAKFALAVCAAGGHRILLIGPPGTGKSMLAARLAGLLPPPTLEERLEITTVLTACNRWPGHIATERPFRSPHHTASFAGMVGGGPQLAPGEITLAHRGVLFLDELPEFRREVLECLRAPLEEGTLTISRAGRQSVMPAKVHLVAAMNPCPCGRHGQADGACPCSPYAIRRYQDRISGPLLDRFDLRLEVATPDLSEMLDKNQSPKKAPIRSLGKEHGSPNRASPERHGSPSAESLKAKIATAERNRQERGQSMRNVDLNTNQLDEVAGVDPEGLGLLERAHAMRALSARSVQSLRRVARTLADLEGEKVVRAKHLAQAIGLRKDGLHHDQPWKAMRPSERKRS